MASGEVHDIAINHPLRHNRKKRRGQYDADEWHNVVMPERIPPDDLLDQELWTKDEIH